MFKMPKGKYDDKTKLVDGLWIVAKRFETDENEMYYILSDGSEVCEKTVSLLLEKPKVKIPQIVADYLEKCKEEGLRLWHAIDIEDCPVDIFPYLSTNMETFARAWLDDYEVEKEKKYKVYLKHTNQELLYYEDTDDFYFDHINKENITKSFTKQELIDAGFGGAFDNEMFEVVEAEDD